MGTMFENHFLVSSVIYLLVFCTTTHASLSSSEFSSRMFQANKMNSYTSFLSRMRRSASTSNPPSSSPTTIKFVVGECDLKAFLHKAKNCSHAFYTAVRKRDATRQECGSKFVTLQRCMEKTMANCIHGSIVSRHLNASDEKKIINNFLVFLGNEDFWCEKGGLGISSDYLPVGSVCDPVFLQVSDGCTSAYGHLFNTTASDDRLCKEYQRAKKCFLSALLEHCSFSRMLLQILEILVEITADFQPFCRENTEHEIIKFMDLFEERTCPPYSLADVAFLLDVTNGTSRGQFMAMRRMIGGVTRSMDYGWNGVQISVYQFDLQLRATIKFGTAPNKVSMQRKVRKMRRTATISKTKAKRMTGRSLKSLARNTFPPDEKEDNGLIRESYRSGHRPYNPAVAFVLTTGTSNDSMISALQELKERNVHVVFLGPSSLKVPPSGNKFLTGSSSYRIINTDFKFSEVKQATTEIAKEICIADKKRKRQDIGDLPEGRMSSSEWGDIQSHFHRLGIYDISLLFELRPFLSAYETPSPPSSALNPGGFPGFTEFTEGFLPSEYVEGMDGDMDRDNLPPVDAGGHLGFPPFGFGKPRFQYMDEYTDEYRY